MIEAKIPPPIVMLVFAVVMRAVATATPALHLASAVRIVPAIVLAGAGLMIEVAGIVSFARARTTADPTHPRAATTLVTEGVYRLTRNPMYVGDFLMLMGWAVWLSSLLAPVGAVIFAMYISAFQIAPEERALSDLFGGQYAVYRSRVRRWL